MNTQLFTSKIAMATNRPFEYIQHVIDVEVQPVLIENGETEWVSDDQANAFGVYLRYSNEAVESLNLNPSEWIADLDTREAAETFQSMIKAFLPVVPEIVITVVGGVVDEVRATSKVIYHLIDHDNMKQGNDVDMDNVPGLACKAVIEAFIKEAREEHGIEHEAEVA